MSDIVNIKELNERIQKESSFVDLISIEINKVIVGQKHLVESLLIGLLSDGHILLEGAPDDVDIREVQKDIEAAIPAVESVHHVHAWCLSENRRLMTLHARVSESAPPEKVAAAIKARLKQCFGVVHATIEIEHSECADAPPAKAAEKA